MPHYAMQVVVHQEAPVKGPKEEATPFALREGEYHPVHYLT